MENEDSYQIGSGRKVNLICPYYLGMLMFSASEEDQERTGKYNLPRDSRDTLKIKLYLAITVTISISLTLIINLDIIYIFVTIKTFITLLPKGKPLNVLTH